MTNATYSNGALRGGGFAPSGGVYPKGTVVQATRANSAQVPADAGAWSIRAPWRGTDPWSRNRRNRVSNGYGGLTVCLGLGMTPGCHKTWFPVGGRRRPH